MTLSEVAVVGSTAVIVGPFLGTKITRNVVLVKVRVKCMAPFID